MEFIKRLAQIEFKGFIKQLYDKIQEIQCQFVIRKISNKLKKNNVQFQLLSNKFNNSEKLSQLQTN